MTRIVVFLNLLVCIHGLSLQPHGQNGTADGDEDTDEYTNPSRPETVKVVQNFFKCAIAGKIPVFARHGFLLGVVRYGGFTAKRDGGADGDVDIGYLEKDRKVVEDFFLKSKCLKNKGETLKRHPQNGCSRPDPSVPLVAADVFALCMNKSANTRFSAHIDGVHFGVMEVVQCTEEMKKDDSHCDYMTDMHCKTRQNCFPEVELFYSAYGHPREMKPEFHYQAAWVENLTTHFTFYNKSILAPAGYKEYLAVKYGPNWEESYDRNLPADEARVQVEQPAPLD